MAKTIVGAFDTIDDAENVALALESHGVDRREIQVVDSATALDYEGRWRREHTGSTSGGGFWSWLFGGNDIEAEQGGAFPEDDSRSYAEGLTRGDAVVVVTTSDDNAQRVRQLMDRLGAENVQDRASGAPSSPRGAESSTTQRSTAEAGDQVIPVVEEQLKVGKRTVDRGGVRVYSHVTERPIEEHLRLREERIKVERRRVDRPLTETPAQAFQEQTIELTESAEEPVVEKHARVVEEVSVGKEVQEREETIRDKARRTDVEVERTGAARSGIAAMEPEFRQHCTRQLSGKGLTYEQCAPAYQYGYELGGDQRHSGDWTAVEADARRYWEQGHPGTWERFKDAIRYAWDSGRGKARAA